MPLLELKLTLLVTLSPPRLWMEVVHILLEIPCKLLVLEQPLDILLVLSTVTKIHDNTGDTLELRNAKPETNHPYNTLYRITGVTAGSSKEVQVASAATVSGASGIGITNLASAAVHPKCWKNT